MPTFGSVLRGTCIGGTLACGAAIFTAFYLYEVKTEGELVLDHAPGVVTILREADSQILHIEGEDWKSAAYGQGFATAQNRLWQIERQRRLAKGELSEFFGKETIMIDAFMRNMEIKRRSIETWESGTLDSEIVEMLKAYADGVNDFVQGVSLSAAEQEQTARILPPEFLVFGITKENFEPWKPADCLMISRLISFHLQANWESDMARETMRQNHPDLELLADELYSFTDDRMWDMVPAVDDDDLKQWGHYSEETLSSRYRKMEEDIKKVSPPLERKDKAPLHTNLEGHSEMLDKYWGSDRPLLGPDMASNNFVVHGDHTATGMPILQSDPHMLNTMPSTWLMYNLKMGDGHNYAGAQLPGAPMIGIGRTDTISWALTTPRVDTADVWKEKLNEDETEYFVDGEWRKLDITTQIIKVMGQPDHEIQIKKTHRGPVMPFKLLQFNAEQLFGNVVPNMPNPGVYSFAWSGSLPGDDTLSFFKTMYASKDLPEFFKAMDEGPLNADYHGFGQNVIMADTSGNIGYRLLMTIPERNDKRPFVSCRVLDGTTTAQDWTGKVIPQRDLPRSLNPKKGFLATANGRQTSDNAINDYGAVVNCPSRIVRINELLSEMISSGKKITSDDMISVKDDVVDVFARRLTPKFIEVSRSVSADLSESQRKDLEKMIGLIGDWQGSFDETSIQATIYNRWYLQILRSLFHNYTEDEAQRMAFSGNYNFSDTIQRLLKSIMEQGSDSRFQPICEGAHPSYKGDNHCAYNIAIGLIETHDFLSSRVSTDPQSWIWRDLHSNEYMSLPWSRTPLKFLFHRSVGTDGNDNTVKSSKISLRKNIDNTVMLSNASANYKMLVQHAKDPKDDVTLYSIDTGMNENPLQGNTFDMNKDHLEGRYQTMKWTKEKLDGTKVSKLTLRPKVPSDKQEEKTNKASKDEL